MVALAENFVGLLSRAFKFGAVPQSPGKWLMSGLIKVGQKESHMPRPEAMNSDIFYKLFLGHNTAAGKHSTNSYNLRLTHRPTAHILLRDEADHQNLSINNIAPGKNRIRFLLFNRRASLCRNKMAPTTIKLSSY